MRQASSALCAEHALLCRWQQLLDEWSASELDTWEAQRLTEQSAVLGSQSSRMSAPGLTFAQVSAGGVVQRGDAAAQQHDEQQQQQQGGSSQQPEQDAVSAAPVLDLSQLVAGAGQQQAQGQQQAVQGETAVVGSAEDEPAQSQGGCCEEQQPQQEPEPEQEMQQLTFARLAQHDYLSPRKIPAGSAGAAATVPGGAGRQAGRHAHAMLAGSGRLGRGHRQAVQLCRHAALTTSLSARAGPVGEGLPGLIAPCTCEPGQTDAALLAVHFKSVCCDLHAACIDRALL